MENPDTKTLLAIADQTMSETVPDGPLTRPKHLGRRGPGPSQVSLDALAAHRGDTQIGGPKTRRCAKCARLAMKDHKLCYWHRPQREREAVRRAKGEPVARTHVVAKRNWRNLVRVGGVPMELVAQPVFGVVAIEIEKILAEMRTGDKSRVHVLKTLYVLRLELVRAWLVASNQDQPVVQPWLDVVQKIRSLLPTA